MSLSYHQDDACELLSVTSHRKKSYTCFKFSVIFCSWSQLGHGPHDFCFCVDSLDSAEICGRTGVQAVVGQARWRVEKDLGSFCVAPV